MRLPDLPSTNPLHDSILCSNAQLGEQQTNFLISFYNFELHLPLNSTDNWSLKSKRRRTDGTGRKQYTRYLSRRFKNGFREGSQAVSKRASATTV
mmetsp:Transcript_17653/g.30665  ORF Transcript_17653/g.30665 Transcript_17653/m.30665 type:complete len:95 (-) Transcript_17653:46-330(-)